MALVPALNKKWGPLRHHWHARQIVVELANPPKTTI
jgi:hypothetical protein